MAKDIKKQILTALGLDTDTNVKLEWQAKLTDGTIVVSSAPELEAGVDIGIMTEDGTTMPLPKGAYETEDGVGFTVEEDGIVAELLTEEEIAPTEDEVVEAGEDEGKDDDEAEVGDWAGMEKRIKNLEDAVADLKGEEKSTEEEVEASAETEDEPQPKKIKTTEEVEFLEEENKRLQAEVSKLSKEPGADKIEFNKFRAGKARNAKKLSREELNKMTALERFTYNVNN